jgi:hypothetical protein
LETRLSVPFAIVIILAKHGTLTRSRGRVAALSAFIGMTLCNKKRYSDTFSFWPVRVRFRSVAGLAPHPESQPI